MEWMKGAIFDLDGTLIDSMWVWNQIDIEFFLKRGIKMPEDYQDAIAPMGFEASARYTKERFELDETIQEIIEEWQGMALDAYSNRILMKPGVEDYLLRLKENGCKLAIATASDLNLVIPVLERHKTLDLFENITTIKEVERGKGYPDIYIKAADKMNLKPQDCAVFEDIVQGVKGAKSGGFYTIGVADISSVDDREAIINLADKYIENFVELM